MHFAVLLVRGALLAALLVASGSNIAAAQSTSHDREARALFEAGRVAYVDERYEDALGHFQRAHELSGRPELLYNVAATLDRLDRESEALVQYEAFLAAVPDAENRVEVEMRLAVLRERATHAAARGGTGAPGSGAPGSGRAGTEGTGGSGDVTTGGTSTEIDLTAGPTEGRTIRAGDPVDVAPAPGGGDVTSEAWFWVVIGAVVVGAGVGITVGVLATQDPGETAYIPGGDGMVIMTLTGALP